VSTICRWLIADFAKYKQTIIRSIASIKGKVTISFDR
jgi:hypothetical protein